MATARASLVGSLVTVGPGKIVDDLDALSKRMGLPMQAGQELIASLFGAGGHADYYRKVWERLDLSAPLASAWVLPPKATAKGYCVAMKFKSADLARSTLDELGKRGAERDGVLQLVISAADSVWAGIKGNTLFVSNSAEALLLAGGLAEAALTAPKDGQLVISILPQALAKASGQSNEQILARLSAALGAAAQSAGGKASPAGQRLAVGVAEALTKMALDTAELRLILEVSPRAGILLRSEVVPQAGTDLATRTAVRSPYAFDERLPVRTDATTVIALGDVSSWFLPFAKAFEASGPAGQAMSKDMTHWFGTVGDVSCVVEPVALGFGSLCSSSLKQGVAAKSAVDAAVALLTSQNVWEAELEGRKAAPLKIKRKKDSVEIEKKIQNTDATARAVAKAMAGGDTIKTVVAVKSGRLVQGTGQKAADLVKSYGPMTEIKNAPLVAATLAGSKNMEGVASADVVAILLKLFGKAKDLPGAQIATMAAALPGVAEMRAPFVFGLQTGASLTADFRIPLASLDNIGKVVQSILGSAGGAAR